MQQVYLYQSKTNFQGLVPIDPSSLGITKDYPVLRPSGWLTPFNSASCGISRLGGKERAAGVYFPYMTAASDAANNAENQNAKGIYHHGHHHHLGVR